MRVFIVLGAVCVLLSALSAMATPAHADVIDDAPHHGASNFVYCEIRGAAAYVESGNSPGHPMSAEDILIAKKLCVREALYGGMGEGYWAMPITDADMRAAKFTIYNR